jgi:tetratricopeptide (TPR) repeat protein
MIKKIVFVFFLSLSLTYAFGLRNVQVGGKLPLTKEMQVFETGSPKLILVANSEKIKTKAYLTAILHSLNKTKVDVFFVDTNSEFAKQSKEEFDKLTTEKHYISDNTKKIFGQFGVIVLPTLLIVNADNTLHSFVSGKKHNLDMIVAENTFAMLQGKKALNIYKKFNEKKAENKNHMALNRAFKMLINKNYEISASLYKKALQNSSTLEGKLGYFYSLLLNDMTDEAVEFSNGFTKEEKGNNRVKFALSCLDLLTVKSQDSFKQVANNCHFETKFFTVIYEAGELLRKNNQLELSCQVYRQAYKVLMNTYRRGR